MIRYYTAAEIAAVYRRPIGTVYRLASTRGWKKIAGQPILYDADDVEKTMTMLRRYRWRDTPSEVT